MKKSPLNTWTFFAQRMIGFVIAMAYRIRGYKEAFEALDQNLRNFEIEVLKEQRNPYFLDFLELFYAPQEAFKAAEELFAQHKELNRIIETNGVKLQEAWSFLPQSRDIQVLKRYFNGGNPEEKREELMEIANLWSNLIHAFRELDKTYGLMNKHGVTMPTVQALIRKLQCEVVSYLPVGNGSSSFAFESLLHSVIDSFDFKNSDYAINRREIQALKCNYGLDPIPKKVRKNRIIIRMQDLQPQYR